MSLFLNPWRPSIAIWPPSIVFRSNEFPVLRIAGSRYVLFLKREASGDFTIVTGYRLSDARVRPLDGEDNYDPRAALVFSSYRGANESKFLHDLRIAIQYGAK